MPKQTDDIGKEKSRNKKLPLFILAPPESLVVFARQRNIPDELIFKFE